MPPFLPFLFPSLFADVDNGVKTRACVECAAALFQRVARCALRVALFFYFAKRKKSSAAKEEAAQKETEAAAEGEEGKINLV